MKEQIFKLIFRTNTERAGNEQREPLEARSREGIPRNDDWEVEVPVRNGVGNTGAKPWFAVVTGVGNSSMTSQREEI